MDTLWWNCPSLQNFPLPLAVESADEESSSCLSSKAEPTKDLSAWCADKLPSRNAVEPDNASRNGPGHTQY